MYLSTYLFALISDPLLSVTHFYFFIGLEYQRRGVTHGHIFYFSPNGITRIVGSFAFDATEPNNETAVCPTSAPPSLSRAFVNERRSCGVP